MGKNPCPFHLQSTPCTVPWELFNGSAMAPDRIREAMSRTETVDEASVRVNDHVTILSPPDHGPELPPKLPLTTRAPATFARVALVSAALGVGGGIGLCVAFQNASLGLYIFAIAAFHLLEFWVTAVSNPRSLGMWSFLLLNGVEYATGHALAVAEYLVKWYLSGEAPRVRTPLLLAALCTLLAGQFVRSYAMVSAAQSFNHFVQRHRRRDHVLVKTGIYGYIRHPSYFGYTLWLISLQILIGNWVMAAVSIFALQYYFTKRLEFEEAQLLKFFGDEYYTYKREVWSGIAFYP